PYACPALARIECLGISYFSVMSSPQKGGMSLPPEDNSDYEEAQLSGFSTVTTRAAARRKAERFDAFQQAQLSPGSSTSKGKEPEYKLSPQKTPEELRLDRLEAMMERVLEHIQETKSHRSSRRSSRH